MYSINNSTLYTRDMLTDVTGSHCVPRTCTNLTAPGINISDHLHNKRCIADQSCILNNVLDYATTDILDRVSKSKKIPPGTDIALNDDAQAVRSKLKSGATKSCHMNIDDNTGTPINLLYRNDGKLDTSRFGNEKTNCFVNNISETVTKTPTQAVVVQEIKKQKKPLTLIAVVMLLIILYASRQQK